MGELSVTHRAALIGGQTIHETHNGARKPEQVPGNALKFSDLPPAVNECPIMDLFDDIGIDPARSPNTPLTPIHSILSFSGVPVPCALM